MLKVLVKGDGGPGCTELPDPPRLCNFACPPVDAFTFIGPRVGLEDVCIAISFRRLLREPERRVVSGFVGDTLYASKLGVDRNVRVVVMVRLPFVESAGFDVAVLPRPE